MTGDAPARSTDRPRPFPWRGLDALTQADVAAGRALRRWSSAFARAEKLSSALSTLLDARIEIVVRQVRSAARAPSGREEGVAVLVGRSDASEIARAVLVEVEPALGVALVARALRRHGPRVLAAGSGADALAGPIAAITLAAARRVHAKQAFRILDAGSAFAIERELAEAAGDLIEASLTVIVNDEAFAARAIVPRAVALAAPDIAWTRAGLAAMGDVPLSLPVVAAVSHSTAGEVGMLRRGDAWLPGAWPLRVAPGGALEGPVLLAPPTGEAGVCAALGEEGRLVVRECALPLTWAPAARSAGSAAWAPSRRTGHEEEEGVTESNKDALVEAVGEVPVVVRVELGAVEMRAREWAALAPGDVVALGKRIGEPVTLRVGGVVVARGELVDLEGEVAVRIVGRADGEAPPAQARPAGQEH